MIPAFGVYLFDLDGTLLDSSDDICGAVHDLFADAGHDGWTTDRLRRYIGLHLGDLFRDMYPACTPAEIDALIQRYREAYSSRGHRSTRLYSGVRETLLHLPGRKAVATSRRLRTTNVLLEKFGLRQFFDHVQGADGMRCKPAPDILLACSAALCVDPGDCLMVGDSPADIQAARHAGMRSCVVDYGYGDPAEIERRGPDYRIADLRQLLAGQAAYSNETFTTTG